MAKRLFPRLPNTPLAQGVIFLVCIVTIGSVLFQHAAALSNGAEELWNQIVEFRVWLTGGAGFLIFLAAWRRGGSRAARVGLATAGVVGITGGAWMWVLQSRPVPGWDWVVPSLDLPMTWIPAGTPKNRNIENGFWIGVHEVTQIEFRRLLQRRYLPPRRNRRSRGREPDDLPVTGITWDEAVEFCHALTAREHRRGTLPHTYAYRLPTEQEWQYACQAGSTNRFLFGDHESDLQSSAWYHANSDGQPHPVQQKLPNAWGLHDLLGNISEWCDEMPSPPLQPESSPTRRPIRGGNWRSFPRQCETTSQKRLFASGRYEFVGFRLLLSRAETR